MKRTFWKYFWFAFWTVGMLMAAACEKPSLNDYLYKQESCYCYEGGVYETDPCMSVCRVILNL